MTGSIFVEALEPARNTHAYRYHPGVKIAQPPGKKSRADFLQNRGREGDTHRNWWVWEEISSRSGSTDASLGVRTFSRCRDNQRIGKIV